MQDCYMKDIPIYTNITLEKQYHYNDNLKQKESEDGLIILRKRFGLKNVKITG